MVGPAREEITITSWLTRRGEVRQLRHQVCLATLRAEAALAPWIVKSRIEWDLKSVRHNLDRTWKDEYLLILWTVMTLALLLSEDLRARLAAIHEDAPLYFLGGWLLIFVATLGFKQALSMLLPGRMTRMVQTMGRQPDEIPNTAVETVAATDPSGAGDLRTNPTPSTTGDGRQ